MGKDKPIANGFGLFLSKYSAYVIGGITLIGTLFVGSVVLKNEVNRLDRDALAANVKIGELKEDNAALQALVERMSDDYRELNADLHQLAETFDEWRIVQAGRQGEDARVNSEFDKLVETVHGDINPRTVTTESKVNDLGNKYDQFIYPVVREDIRRRNQPKAEPPRPYGG